MRLAFDCCLSFYEKINFFLIFLFLWKEIISLEVKSERKKLKKKHFGPTNIDLNQYLSLWATENVTTKKKFDQIKNV